MRVALLISGGGSTAQTVINATKHGKLYGLVTPALVISSDPHAGGLQKAQELDVPCVVIERDMFSTQEEFGKAILTKLADYQIDFVSQNGWLMLTPKNVIEAFTDKIINQHPGPLDPGHPDFGGKGMFGARVMCARLIYCVLSQGEHLWTEATVHHVTEEFDNGELISVRTLSFARVKDVTQRQIEEDVTIQKFIKEQTKQLQQQLLPLEHENVIEALYLFARGNNPVFLRKNRLVPDENVPLLTFAKKMAIQLFPEG